MLVCRNCWFPPKLTNPITAAGLDGLFVYFLAITQSFCVCSLDSNRTGWYVSRHICTQKSEQFCANEIGLEGEIMCLPVGRSQELLHSPPHQILVNVFHCVQMIENQEFSMYYFHPYCWIWSHEKIQGIFSKQGWQQNLPEAWEAAPSYVQAN